MKLEIPATKSHRSKSNLSDIKTLNFMVRGVRTAAMLGNGRCGDRHGSVVDPCAIRDGSTAVASRHQAIARHAAKRKRGDERRTFTSHRREMARDESD
jgi:hypothetical protein